MNKTQGFSLPEHRRPKLERHPEAPENPEPYVAAESLVTAVNLAIYLERPLLLEGEAGCGKSRLARHLAYELGLPLYEWPVRSTSRAQDGLYTYDAILRLHDVHIQQAQSQDSGAAPPKPPGRDPQQPMDYVKFGALGKAFNLLDCPAVVLIDEIDKADMDFPNDLLTVLDEPWQFPIPEADHPGIKATHKPIVIITSNKEKGNLPEPFLRRCVYFFIEFPKDRLLDIINAHYAADKNKAPSKKLSSAACQRFLQIRESNLHKKPGTSELLDWLEAMRGFGSSPDWVSSLQSDESKLPYPELLFKVQEDWWRYVRS